MTDELKEALAAHATRQRAHAADLRRQAGEIRQKARETVSRHPGNDMAAWRTQHQAGREGEARTLEIRADRAELRATRAEKGKLVHGTPENADRDYLDRQDGYRLIRLARPAGIVVSG